MHRVTPAVRNVESPGQHEPTISVPGDDECILEDPETEIDAGERLPWECGVDLDRTFPDEMALAVGRRHKQQQQQHFEFQETSLVSAKIQSIIHKVNSMRIA